MVLGTLEAQEGLAEPQGALGTAVALDHRGEWPVEAQDRRTFVEYVVAPEELQQGSGRDPSGKTGIACRVPEIEVGGEGGGGRVAVDAAPAPHGHVTLGIEHSVVGLHELVGVVLELMCKIRFLLIAVPSAPDGCVYLEGPGGIVVEGMAVPVPALAGIVREDRLGMLSHDGGIDVVAHHVEERQVEHVEQSPVLCRGGAFGIVADERGDPVLLLPAVGVPDLLLRRDQSDYDCTGLDRLLVGMQPERRRRVPVHVAVAEHILLVSRCAGAQYMVLVVRPQVLSTDLHVGLYGDQGCGDEEAAFKSFIVLRLHLPGRSAAVGIRDLGLVARNEDGIVHRLHVTEHPLQNIFAGIDPMPSGHARVRARIEIRILR